MAVTWPLPPGSTLADPARPITFTTERDVAAVSVALGDRRVEERAYRDGAFVWPYLRSQRSGNTFTLVRDDGLTGWPADPKPFVDEAPSIPPPAATQWDTLKEFDFTTLPTQAYAAWGFSTMVLDGYTFKVRSVPNGNMAQQRLGEGFYLATIRGWNEGVTVQGPFLALDPSQLPAYVESRPHAIIAYAVVAEQTGGNCRFAVGSFQTNTNGDGANGITSTTQITGSYVRTSQFVIRPKLLSQVASTSTPTTQVDISTPSYACDGMVFGSVRKNRTTGWALHAPWNGSSLPTIEEMLVSEGTNTAVDAGSLDFGVGVSGSGAAGQTVCRIKKMRILQLRVP